MICSTSSIGSIEHGLLHFSYLVVLLDKSWRRKWKLTPIFLPEISQGQRNLVGYSPQGRKVSDTTLQLNTHTHTHTQRISPWGNKELDTTDHACMHTRWTLCPKLIKNPSHIRFYISLNCCFTKFTSCYHTIGSIFFVWITWISWHCCYLDQVYCQRYEHFYFLNFLIYSWKMVSKSDYYVNPFGIQFLISHWFIISVQIVCSKVYDTYSIFLGY